MDSWTKLAAIREFDNLDDPASYGVATVEELKKKYPLFDRESQDGQRDGRLRRLALKLNGSRVSTGNAEASETAVP